MTTPLLYGLLAFAVIMYSVAEFRKRRALQLAASDAENARAARLSLVHDIRVLSTVVQTLAVHQAKDDQVLKEHLVGGLRKADTLCDRCPFFYSAICDDCGRYASGAGRSSSAPAH